MSDAFDLLFRTQIDSDTKDIPGLTALYRNHEKPLFHGYLRNFVPPNKVVISEFPDSHLPTAARNQSITLTLLSVSADPNTKTVTEFMKALLNVKQCNTLISEKESYKYFTGNPQSDKDKEQAKKQAESYFTPLLEVVIMYPWAYDYQQEEFFNEKNELSGIVLLERTQSVCHKKDNEFVHAVNLGQLMLQGTDETTFSAPYFLKGAGDDFINLNQYLAANGLRAVDQGRDDPRETKFFIPINLTPTPEGIKTILKVGAAQ